LHTAAIIAQLLIAASIVFVWTRALGVVAGALAVRGGVYARMIG